MGLRSTSWLNQHHRMASSRMSVRPYLEEQGGGDQLGPGRESVPRQQREAHRPARRAHLMDINYHTAITAATTAAQAQQELQLPARGGLRGPRTDGPAMACLAVGVVVAQVQGKVPASLVPAFFQGNGSVAVVAEMR